MENLLKTLLIAIIFSMTLVVVVNAEEVYCAHNLEIVYDNPVDLSIAIPAVEKARKFFEKLGYKSDYPEKLVFQEAVYLDIPILGGDKVIKERIYGAYFGNFSKDKKNVIYVSSWDTDYLHTGSRDCFNIPVTLELHATIVTHETAHLLLRAISGKLGHGVNEYIAYTTQIATMSESLRNKVVEAYPNVEMFESEFGINGMIHAHNPHKFGVMSYLHFSKTGSDTFKSIVAGKLDPDVMMDALYGINP